jgi:hypothetical protein
MAYLIDRLEQELGTTNYEPGSRRSRTWLRKKINDLKPTAQTVMADRQRLKNSAFIGGMYFFYYDPKHKKTLPYYDTFPLVIPIEQYPDGFLGLNLHYIHPKQRILLLDTLSAYKTNNNYDEKTRLKLSYDFLRRVSSAYQATPCIKRYLFTQVNSRFLEITANEWDIAIMLPVEQFTGATSNKVWNDSRKKF